MGMWYETTETHMSANGTLTIINASQKTLDRLAKDAATKAWLDRAKVRDEYPTIYTRAALAALDAKVLTDAKVTVDVAAPSTGTAQTKADAVAVKMATVISTEDWDKVEAVLAKAEPVDEKIAAVELPADEVRPIL